MQASSWRGWLAITLAMVSAQGAIAAASHPCATVVDPNERLACYDAAFPPADNVRIGNETLEQLHARQLQEFGLSGVQKQSREPEQVRNARVDRIEAVVGTIYVSATGERIVTLDNGQLWMITEINSKAYLRKGDKIVIRTAAMGTFMLVTPDHIAVRAKRIQ